MTSIAAGPHSVCFAHYIDENENILRCAKCGTQVIFDPAELAALEIAQHRLGRISCTAAVKEAA